jgi:hypothetical protein
VGLGKWTERIASAGDVARWRREPDYAISLQCRTVRAIDIDVPDPAKADAIELLILNTLDGIVLPKRYRENSGKRLLGFRFDGLMPKRVIPVDGGIVEFLGDGQQFVASGSHDSGVPYLWDCAGGLPSAFPALTADELEHVWSTMVMLLATGEPKIAREKRAVALDPDAQVETSDEQAAWLYEHWDVYETGQEGQIFLRCPFEHEHTTDSNETATAYFIAGTGGYERGHWVCLHGHCTGREDADFERGTGYRGANFTALEALSTIPSVLPTASGTALGRYHLPEFKTSDLPMPGLKRDKNGLIGTTADNLNKLLVIPEVIKMHLGLDTFRNDIMWSHLGYEPGNERWQPFSDADYTRVRIMLERIGLEAIGIEMLRAAVHFAAAQREFDSAQVWLAGLAWDGVPRVRRFMTDYLGAADTPYTAAVSRYIWTALAGRVVEPGCQVDMVPILYGAQGLRKTTAVKMMAPSGETYTDINLSERDDNLSRRLRGKLIGELEELRGLQSRDSEAIKAWITRTHEEWIPKFKEFGTTFARRLLLIGTTNKGQMLADETGERRWLPMALIGKIDIDAIKRDRDQLWAEGAAMHRIIGVDWEDAERLARDEHEFFKVEDPWQPSVAAWLAEVDLGGLTVLDKSGGVSAVDVLVGALGMAPRDIDHGRKMRVSRIMISLGLAQERVGKSRERMWVRV